MFSKILRLAGLGAFGACGGLLAIYAGFVFLTQPGGSSGMDTTTAVVGWIALAGVTAALIIVHIAIGRQLLVLAERPGMRQPL